MNKHILLLLERQPVATVIIYSTCTVFLRKLPHRRPRYLKYSGTIPTILWPLANAKMQDASRVHFFGHRNFEFAWLKAIGMLVRYICLAFWVLLMHRNFSSNLLLSAGLLFTTTKMELL